MEVASSSSATGKLKVFSRLESGLRLIEISARHSQVPLEVTIPFLTTLGQTCTPASPEVACAGGAYVTQPQRRPADVYTKRRRSAPRARRIEQVRARRVRRARDSAPRLGRSCLRVLPRAGARPSGTRSPRQRHPRLGRSCLQSRCAPVGYEEPERMPEVPQTWMVEGPPSQPKPSPGRASVPQGSLPSPKRSILM